MTQFELDPQLKADTIEICDLDLCKVLLMNEAQFPWIILVPQHIHHIVRFKSDPVWPKPVWGHFKPKHYSIQEKQQLVEQLRNLIK